MISDIKSAVCYIKCIAIRNGNLAVEYTGHDHVDSINFGVGNRANCPIDVNNIERPAKAGGICRVKKTR